MEKQNQLISVVIPVYNQERYLDRCLKSVLNQTYPNLEIICADDGSQDRTKKIIQKWAKKDSRVHVLELPHSGVSICRNRGIEASGGDYLLFVDSDDYIGKNMIEILYENILRLDADMCVCGYFECMKKAVKRHSFLPSGVYDTGDYRLYKDGSGAAFSDVNRMRFYHARSHAGVFFGAYIKNNGTEKPAGF